MLYHPDRDKAELHCYVMRVTLPVNVSIASSLAELQSPGEETEVTVEWAKEYRYTEGKIWWLEEIRIRNLFSETYRTLPVGSTTIQLMEGIRTGLARKRGPRGSRKEREELPRVVVTPEQVTYRIERMMAIVSRGTLQAANG